jgi:hypothetical protein
MSTIICPELGWANRCNEETTKKSVPRTSTRQSLGMGQNVETHYTSFLSLLLVRADVVAKWVGCMPATILISIPLKCPTQYCYWTACRFPSIPTLPCKQGITATPTTAPNLTGYKNIMSEHGHGSRSLLLAVRGLVPSQVPSPTLG